MSTGGIMFCCLSHHSLFFVMWVNLRRKKFYYLNKLFLDSKYMMKWDIVVSTISINIESKRNITHRVWKNPVHKIEERTGVDLKQKIQLENMSLPYIWFLIYVIWGEHLHSFTTSDWLLSFFFFNFLYGRSCSSC